MKTPVHAHLCPKCSHMMLCGLEGCTTNEPSICVDCVDPPGGFTYGPDHRQVDGLPTRFADVRPRNGSGSDGEGGA